MAARWAAEEAWTVKLDTTSRAIRRAQSVGSRPRLEVRGKFFFAGDEKVPLRGVTYGPFAPDAEGYRFPAPEVVERDLALITELGANCLRLFTPPPRWLLDMAAERNLWVMVGIPWAEHVCFLDSEEITDVVRRTVREVVEACRSHPAVGAFLIGNEIPPDIVRWYGPQRIAGFLRELVGMIKSIEPDRPGRLRQLPLHRVPRDRLHRLPGLQRLPALRARSSAATCRACTTWPATGRWS